ncbi:MAG: hypothetical protein LBT68_01155 [Spirochaetales bacterium]|nr:hypothetical protein [Spirochaetales bacterium]
MKNITLAIDDQTLELGREYAKKQNVSFNALVRRLVEQTVKPSSGDDWLEETFRLMDKARGNSRGKKWTREDLYFRGRRG